MDLQYIIYNIKDNIDLERQNIIYLGVGTAAGYRDADNSLNLKNYHQYPPFLQDLKNTLNNVNINIILIDPNQENPPYMVKDKGLQCRYVIDKGSLCTDVIDKGPLCTDVIDKGLIDNTIYTNNDQSLTVYTWREIVYTEPYRDKEGIDITEQLRDLNNYAMDKGILFIYHDFSGRANSVLAEYFDEDIGEHLDHIIYGLGLREDFGCYFNLTDPCSYHPFKISPSGHIELFNVYYYIVNDKLGKLKMDTNTYAMDTYAMDTNANNKIFNAHMEKMLYIVKHELNNITLQALRVVFRLITGEDVKDFDKDVTNFNFFNDKNKRESCIQLIYDKNYSELYDFLLTEFGKKLDIVALFKGLDITGREMLEFITLGDDPFIWYNNVKEFI
jgi:hypothetical protein